MQLTRLLLYHRKLLLINMTYKRKLAIFSKVFACPSSISTEVKMQRHFKNAGCFRQPILEGLILCQLWS